MTLSGQVALVTGGDGGIGAECSRVLAAAGARVAINYRMEAAAADDLCEQIHQDGGRATPSTRVARGSGGSRRARTGTGR